MVSLARAGDNQGLAKLIASGHVVLKDIPVKVLARGEEPDSPIGIRVPRLAHHLLDSVAMGHSRAKGSALFSQPIALFDSHPSLAQNRCESA